MNSVILSWLCNTFTPTLKSSIAKTKIAKDLWDDTKQRFHVANDAGIHELKVALVNCKQKKVSMVMYYACLNKLSKT